MGSAAIVATPGTAIQLLAHPDTTTPAQLRAWPRIAVLPSADQRMLQLHPAPAAPPLPTLVCLIKRRLLLHWLHV